MLLRAICSAVLLLVGVFPIAFSAHAQEVHQDLIETVRAEVTAVLSEREEPIMGTEAVALVQNVEAEILEGEKKGVSIRFENDVAKVAVGDKIYIQRLVTIEGSEYYMLKDFDRHGSLILLLGVFIAILVFVARWHGIRAFISLIASIGIIGGVLVPSLLAGYPPVLVSTGVAGVILALAIFVTHGFRPSSYIAFLGTFLSVVATGALAYLFVWGSHLTGFASDAAIYLNIGTRGALDFSGLLLGGIIIGVLGVLDDVAITQAAVVTELSHANPSFTPYQLYVRAMRVGRDHIGSLINTLALAYTGVSLPLILLFARTDASLSMTINQEVVASELVRTLVGSIGLILAVPITTGIAVWWIAKFGNTEGQDHHHHH